MLWQKMFHHEMLRSIVVKLPFNSVHSLSEYQTNFSSLCCKKGIQNTSLALRAEYLIELLVLACYP
ncbi:hypothetical protein, partial [Moritella viscosa]|uniref:hypothetical protein n=1 Tax=Moritella viscosa TaxID=80854 RepID=UPI001C31BF99